MTTELCKVPVKSTVIRKAEAADIAASPSRLLLLRAEDGRAYWVHIDGSFEWLAFATKGAPPNDKEAAE